MPTQTQIFKYQGNSISFDFGEDHKMINATEMAKPFGLKPAHFLRMKQTKAFINVLKKQVANSQLEIVTVTRGGFGHGTWMHEKLALKFAAWLSPDFELWVFDRIQELLLKGHTAIVPAKEPVIEPVKDNWLEMFDIKHRIGNLEHAVKMQKAEIQLAMEYLKLAMIMKAVADKYRVKPSPQISVQQYDEMFLMNLDKAMQTLGNA